MKGVIFMPKVWKYIIISVISLIIVILLINFYIVFSVKNQILSEDEYLILKDIDCIVVLGAGVRDDKPSPLLEDRLKKAIELYNKGISKKIIMSGDHGKVNYDEVNIMKDYAIKEGVSSEDIFMDHAGFSTYETIYRAKEIFQAKRIVVVTQEYHLYRTLYIANKLGVEAYGVSAKPNNYSGGLYREFREVLARNKDFIYCIFKPKPTYLGEVIPVTGNGDVTNDKDLKEE